MIVRAGARASLRMVLVRGDRLRDGGRLAAANNDNGDQRG